MGEVSKPILEAFARFDADGSGSISRDELAAVLLSLDGSWTDESIDQLLVEADSSYDGELQIDEFIRWVFAEDSKVLGSSVKGAVSDATLLVAGCSRWEDFDGEYVQVKGMTHGRRPVFYCTELKKYLYYHGKRNQWQIHHKIGNYASCRLKTKRAVHIVGYDTSEVWGVWNESKRCFIKEPDMGVCLYPPPTPEELVEMAPTLAYQAHCPVESVEGEEGEEGGKPSGLGLWWKLTATVKMKEQLLNGRPVYQKMQRQEDGSLRGVGSYLFFAGGKWKMCQGTLAELEEAPVYASSEETQSYSPAKATWTYKGKARQWTTPNQEDFRAVPAGWNDPDFAGMGMIGVWIDQEKAECVRALELSKFKSADHKAVLFGDVEPGDAMQGGLGDCWLMASIACMAEFPSYIQDHIFQTKEIAEDGKYELKLFDYRSKEWKVITIDDYLVCYAGALKDPQWATPMFAKLPSGKMWAVLLEKAIAKLLSSYQALDGGTSSTAFAIMTGCTEHIRHGAPHGAPTPEWKALAEIGVVDSPGGQQLGSLQKGATFQEVERDRYHVKFQKLEGEGPAEGWVPYYVKGHRVATRTTKYPWCVYSIARDDKKIEESDDEKMWQRILQLDLGNYPLSTCASAYRSKEMNLRDGLVAEHVYSVLHVKEACGCRLVCMRNPWGQFEWMGPWNDKGEEFQAHPEVANALQMNLKSDSDGTFWMDYEDFTWNMDGVLQTMIAMPTKRGGQAELVEDDVAE